MKNKLTTLVLFICFVTNTTAQKTIFWEVNDTVNHRKSYLLGTCHIIGASFIDSFEVVMNALKNSSTAIFEVVDEDKADKYILQNRERSDSIQMVLTKKEYKHLKSINPDWTDDFLQKLKPLELKMKLIMGVSMRTCGHYGKNDALIYLDDYLEQKSKKYGIKTVGLETGSEQIEVISRLPNKTWHSERNGIKSLIKISQSGKYHPGFCRDEQSYIHLELPYNLEKPCPDEPLLKGRNKTWMPRLLEHLSRGNCFVAVGQSHLAHDCGLIVKLRENGYVVTPVMLK